MDFTKSLQESKSAVTMRPVAIKSTLLLFLLYRTSLFYMTKNLRQKTNILKMKRAFKIKSKAFFISFKGLSKR